MSGSFGESLPLVPLVRAYVDSGVPATAELGRLPGLGPRLRAVQAATATFLDDAFLDGAANDTFQTALVRFYEACVEPPLHVDCLRRRAGIVRHAIAHLLRCPDPLSQKLQRCLAGDGPYFVAGLGPSFWSAVAQGLRPAVHAAWTPAVEAGVRRLGLLGLPGHDSPEAVYSALLGACTRLRALAPGLSALHCEHFLSLVALMEGRDLFAGAARVSPVAPGADVVAAVRAERARQSLRERIKERGRVLAEAQERLEAGLANGDAKLLGEALTATDPDGSARCALDWGGLAEELVLWIGRLWEADDPYLVLAGFWAGDPIPSAGLWLPAAVLHLRDAQVYGLWNDAVRAGLALLDDASDRGPLAERYRLFNEGSAWLRQRYGLHPLEMPAVLAALAPSTDPSGRVAPAGPASHHFGGFCADTFRFLRELAENNSRDWMERQRERYQFAVRAPLVELCQALSQRYVEPVLCRQHGWDLRTDARNGLALTSVVKNDYGRSRPYNTTLWVTFCQRDQAGKRHATQFFVRLDPGGVSYGLNLGASTRPARQQLRQRLLTHAQGLYQSLAERGTFDECRLHAATDPEGTAPAGEDDFHHWLSGKELSVARSLPPDAPLLAGDELVGDVLLTFDRLLPLYACAAGAEPEPPIGPEGRFTEADFRRETYLGDDWLRRARGLLQLKRQLILQGVPGTGKTHVARCLARLLTGDAEALRLVQFHAAYSYEEFVEGIKAKSVEVNGRHDVTYPVEEGLLCTFAARAASQPSQPHVLLIDEINRGNLPRIFGELLYLLEYRDQEVVLPYSRRSFRLPPNLYLLGTMNASDRSVALIDQALRRRFSFLEMSPDAAVLASWLAAHPPADGSGFAARVVALFERLNARLRTDLGPQFQVGHSYFMVPHLDEARLRVIWQHQLRPLLEEYALTQPGRSLYELDDLLDDGPRRPSGRKRHPSTSTP